MSYTPWDQASTSMPLLVNSDFVGGTNEVVTSYVSRLKRNVFIWWGILLFFVIGGGICITLAFVLPGAGPDGSVPLFWGLTGTSIALFSIGVTLLMLVPIYHCVANGRRDAILHWSKSPLTLSWNAGDFSPGLWQQFYQEEFGSQGRSITKYDWKKFVEIVVVWIILMLVCFGAAAIRLALTNAVDFGPLSWIQVCLILGGGIGTLTTIMLYVIPEIVLLFKKSTYKTPEAFLANSEGICWMGEFYNIDPTNTNCCAGAPVLEHRRLNTYQMRMTPCMEFCFSKVVKNGKAYEFVRVPVPAHKMEEASHYINSNFAQAAQDATVWKAHLKSFAADLEEANVQVVSQ